jgi:hypothetical protein
MATQVQNHTWIFRKDYDLTWWRQNPIRWKWWSTMKFGATLFWDKSKYGEHQVKYFIVQYEVDVEITYIYNKITTIIVITIIIVKIYIIIIIIYNYVYYYYCHYYWNSAALFWPRAGP